MLLSPLWPLIACISFQHNPADTVKGDAMRGPKTMKFRLDQCAQEMEAKPQTLNPS